MSRAKTIRESEVYRVQLPALHPAQMEVLRGEKKFNVLCCGRRWGKSKFAEDRLIHPALEGFPVAWFAPTNKILNEAWESIKKVVLPITIRKQEDKKIIDLITGGKIEMWSTEDPDAGRSRRYKRVVVDEAAHVRHLQYAWNNVINPTLIDYDGDAWFPSSPNGANYYKKLFDFGQDPLKPEWASWQMPSHRNPFLKERVIENMRTSMGEAAFSQEVLAQFVSAEGAVFRKINEAIRAQRQADPLPDHQYAFGIDWGRRKDATVIAIIDLTLRALVAMERWTNLEYPIQKERVRLLWQKWQPISVVAEENSIGGPIIEDLRAASVPVKAFQTNNASKAEIIDDLVIAFEREDFALIDDPVLISELGMFEAFRLPSGLIRYEAPAGQHDDTVIALAIAYQALGKAKKLGRIVIGGLVRPSAWGNMAGR